MKKIICILAAFSLVAGVYAAPKKPAAAKPAPAVAAPAVAPAAAAPAAQPGGKVNAGSVGVQLKGYAGFGPTIAYGNQGTSSSLPTSGLSEGNGFVAGANPMLSWKFLAFEPGFHFYTFSKFSQGTASSEGSGKVIVLDGTGGFKLFTERDDMGYTYFYGGFRYWSASGNIGATSQSLSVSGAGWIAGFRDYSTFRVSGAYAIGLTTGLWVASVPASKFTLGGADTTLTSPTGIGLGYEVLLGLAIEDIGLAIDAGIRTDVLATVGNSSATNYTLFAFGAAAYVLQVNYVLQ
jgi:hypothetical protein